MVVIITALVLLYVFFIRNNGEQKTSSLVSSSGSQALPASTTGQNSLVAKDFLSLLLNVKSIKLDDIIFSDLAFNSLHDSSILLIPDRTEGRQNPFAPIGFEAFATPFSPDSFSFPKNTGIKTN